MDLLFLSNPVCNSFTLHIYLLHYYLAMMPFLTKGKIGGGGAYLPRRNNNRPPQSPSHCLPPAADHAASWRCDFDGRSIPLPPPAPQRATQPSSGRGRQLRCWARGRRESAGCRGRNYIREEPKRQSVAAGGVSCRAGGGGGRPGCQGRERVVIVVVAIVVVVVVVLSLVWILARRQ